MNMWQMLTGFGFWQWIGFLLIIGMILSTISTMYTKTVYYVCKCIKRGSWD